MNDSIGACSVAAAALGLVDDLRQRLRRPASIRGRLRSAHRRRRRDAPLTCLALVEQLTICTTSRRAPGTRTMAPAPDRHAADHLRNRSSAVARRVSARVRRDHPRARARLRHRSVRRRRRSRDEDLRRACETQIKSHLVHLREGFIESGGRPQAIADLVAASAPAFAALLRNVARLNGGDDPTSANEATRDGATRRRPPRRHRRGHACARAASRRAHHATPRACSPSTWPPWSSSRAPSTHGAREPRRSRMSIAHERIDGRSCPLCVWLFVFLAAPRRAQHARRSSRSLSTTSPTSSMRRARARDGLADPLAAAGHGRRRRGRHGRHVRAIRGHPRIRREDVREPRPRHRPDAARTTALLVLLAVNDRQVWVEVGYDLEEFITDGFAGETSRQVHGPGVPARRLRRRAAGGRLALRRPHRGAAERHAAGRAAPRAPATRATDGVGRTSLLAIFVVFIVHQRHCRTSSAAQAAVRRGRWGGSSERLAQRCRPVRRRIRWRLGGGGGGFGGGFGGFGGGRSGGGGRRGGMVEVE